MQQDIRHFLADAGFTGTEIRIYLAGFLRESIRANALAAQTGIQRTTVYNALTTLIQKGLVSKHVVDGITWYTMYPPEIIKTSIQNKIDALKGQLLDFEKLIPLFNKLGNEQRVETGVAYFDGVSGMKTAINQALYCQSRSWKILAPHRNFFSELDLTYAKYFMQMREERGITAKSIWERSFVAHRKFSKLAVSIRNPRLLPRSLEGRFKTTMILFDKKIAFISSLQEHTAIIIQSEEIYDLLDVLFDGLWMQSEPLTKKYIQPDLS